MASIVNQPQQRVISVRDERPGDEAFLFDLYSSTRQEELDAWGWPPELRKDFLSRQFRASQARHEAYPEAEFQIVLLNGIEAGRMIVQRTPEALHLVDIALLPQHRGSGIGTALMLRVLGEAMGTGKPLRLMVLKNSRALGFYKNLGFTVCEDAELHIAMEWRASLPVARARQVPDSLKLPLQFNPARLQSDLARILTSEFIPHFNKAGYEGDWSAVPLRSIRGRPEHIYPDPTAKDQYANTPLLDRCPYFREVLNALRCPQQAARLLRLRAGSVIKEHRDHELGFEDGEVRLHIPVVTNPNVEFVLNNLRVVMNEGECWYLNVNEPHRVANHGTADRIHLVVDCVLNDWLRGLLLNTPSFPLPQSFQGSCANPAALRSDSSLA